MSLGNTPQKRTTVSLGRQAEQFAADYLASQGYIIVTRNHRCVGGEVDMIAWDGVVLCFVEVRYRATVDFGDPLETIDRRKISRICKAAYHFLEEAFDGPWPTMRFDAIGIVSGEPPHLTLIRDAFEAVG